MPIKTGHRDRKYEWGFFFDRSCTTCDDQSASLKMMKSSVYRYDQRSINHSCNSVYILRPRFFYLMSYLSFRLRFSIQKQSVASVFDTKTLWRLSSTCGIASLNSVQLCHFGTDTPYHGSLCRQCHPFFCSAIRDLSNRFTLSEIESYKL